MTIMTGSSSDDWILLALQLQPLLITLNHSSIADSHHLQFTVTHALGFSVCTTQNLALQITMKSSCHFLFNRLGMQTRFFDSNSPVSVLHGTNLYSQIS
jgi:hypothetical protein